MKEKDKKDILAAIERREVKLLSTMLITEAYKDIDEHDYKDVSAEQYGRYTQTILNRISRQLKSELKKAQVHAQTMDLEVLIEKVKTGEEPVWFNKITKKK